METNEQAVKIIQGLMEHINPTVEDMLRVLPYNRAEQLRGLITEANQFLYKQGKPGVNISHSLEELGEARTGLEGIEKARRSVGIG